MADESEPSKEFQKKEKSDKKNQGSLGDSVGEATYSAAREKMMRQAWESPCSWEDGMDREMKTSC